MRQLCRVAATKMCSVKISYILFILIQSSLATTEPYLTHKKGGNTSTTESDSVLSSTETTTEAIHNTYESTVTDTEVVTEAIYESTVTDNEVVTEAIYESTVTDNEVLTEADHTTNESTVTDNDVVTETHTTSDSSVTKLFNVTNASESNKIVVTMKSTDKTNGTPELHSGEDGETNTKGVGLFFIVFSSFGFTLILFFIILKITKRYTKKSYTVRNPNMEMSES